MNKKANSLYGLRAKLISAMCMLLVAMIMVISSTYAWFTLSTAPEVKGINTAIGANGALEMALTFSDVAGTGTIQDVLDGVLTDGAIANHYWGNLVDVSENTVYGTGDITLLPSQLNYTSADNKLNSSSLLKTPVYGADGRVSGLESNTVTGTYVNRSFSQNNNYGFRAVGVASGMTDRELAYRNAKAAASTAMGLARTIAAGSLETNGSNLANIAIKHGTSSGGDTYTQEDVAYMTAIVDDLLGTTTKTGALEYIEEAYKQYILAYVASNATYGEGNGWRVVKGLVEDETKSLADVVAQLETYAGTTVVNADFMAPINALNATIASVKSAQTDIAALTGDSIAWADISTPLNKLADTDGMLVNGKTVAEIKADIGAFATDAMKNGVTVSMKTGGGVYADIADHCTDYKASITMDIDYNGTTLNDFPATMATATTVKPAYLQVVAGVVPEFGRDTNAEAAMPLTEFYGYVIDLAFRTNAAESYLLLQTEATDRIYDDNKENADETDINNTWGNGSTMTFTSSSTSFTFAQMKSLLKNVRVVFYNTTSYEVYGVAVLDADAAVNNGGEYEANIYMLQVTTTVTTTVVPGENSPTEASNTETTTTKIVTDATYAMALGTNTVTQSTTDETTGDVTTVETTVKVEMVKETEDAQIKALTQNATERISALVYLDGTTIGNGDVAADAAASVSGKLNLQFSSSANLVPMEYADFHNPSAETEAEETTATNPTT